MDIYKNYLLKYQIFRFCPPQKVKNVLFWYFFQLCNVHSIVLEERVNHGIALSLERDEVDRKKRRAADTIHFLFPWIFSLEYTSYMKGVLNSFAKSH
jgi:hypothetical protein